MLGRLTMFVALIAIARTQIPLSGQAINSPVHTQTPFAVSVPADSVHDAKSEYGRDSRDDQQPQIIVTVPAPPPWTLHDRILWISNLVLAILGYAAVLVALSTLKKIERLLRSVESSASAAADRSNAALLSAQAAADSQRPWLVITVQPSESVANGFNVMATNRGGLPARIVANVDQLRIAIDESHLPTKPEYQNEKSDFPFVSSVLLPGEFMAIKAFCRDDMQRICDSREGIKRIENWEEKVFIFGKIIYSDLIARPEIRTYETAWCCWYIHGRNKSGLVITGPSELNSHT